MARFLLHSGELLLLLLLLSEVLPFKGPPPTLFLCWRLSASSQSASSPQTPSDSLSTLSAVCGCLVWTSPLVVRGFGYSRPQLPYFLTVLPPSFFIPSDLSLGTRRNRSSRRCSRCRTAAPRTGAGHDLPIGAIVP